MKYLVELTTQDITKAAPVASTTMISKEYGKLHKNVLKKIEKLIESPSSTFFTRLNLEPSEYIDDSGKSNKEYLLNKDQFTFLVLGFTGEKASIAREKYIKAFNHMEHELMAREKTRAIGKRNRLAFTDSIKNNLEDNTTHKKFAFGNYSKLVYKKVLGCTVKKAKANRDLNEKDSIRDFLTESELEQVQVLEVKVANLIEGFSDLMTDKEVYQKIKDNLDK